MPTNDPYELEPTDLKALEWYNQHCSGPDGLKLMNALMRWTDPPPMDERWERKVAAACQIVQALHKQVLNYKEKVRKYKSKLRQLRRRIRENG